MLAKYHFKIKHVKGPDNVKANAFNRKEKLQRNDKVLKARFKKNSNKRIRYNHP